jgi:hypothetical protein
MKRVAQNKSQSELTKPEAEVDIREMRLAMLQKNNNANSIPNA